MRNFIFFESLCKRLHERGRGRYRLYALILSFAMILNLFVPMGNVFADGSGRYIHSEYIAGEDAILFKIKDDEGTHAFIRCAASGWGDREDFKATRPDGSEQSAEMILKLPYSKIEGSDIANGYKAFVYRNDAGNWMSADGWNNDNARFPERGVPKFPRGATAVRSGDNQSVVFTIKANRASHGYILGRFNGWNASGAETQSEDINKYRFERDLSDSTMVQDMSVTISYDDLKSEEQKNEYKLYLYYPDEMKWEWVKADNHPGENSLFPENPNPQEGGGSDPQQPPTAPNTQNYVKTRYIDEEGGKVEFVIKADGYDFGYLMCEANGWKEDEKFKFQRNAQDVNKTSEMSITKLYSDIESNQKYAQYKVKLYKTGEEISPSNGKWMRHDGLINSGDNSRFPYRKEKLRDLVFYSAMMDSKEKIKLFLSGTFIDEFKKFKLFVDGTEYQNFTASEESNGVIVLNVADVMSEAGGFEPGRQILIKREGSDVPTRVVMRKVLDEYVYDGDDLGITFSDDYITMKLWSPVASKVDALIYDHYNDFITDKENPAATIDLDFEEDTGVHSATVPRSAYEDKYYIFKLTFGKDGDPDKEVKYAVDPYAKAVGTNGVIGVLVDIDGESTKIDGFDDHAIPQARDFEDSILYEMHVRDFTIGKNWGGNPQNAGKYLGVIEPNTKYAHNGQEVATGLDHLKELGITHIHLLPTYDFSSTDESKPAPYDETSAHQKAKQRNWGYDPLNYNVPEGSYSSDASDPKARIKEYRQMVKGLHEADIKLVIDVVYNHMASTENMDNIVPGYYFRTWDNGDYTNDSGCGNAVETRNPMVRKFIVDSCVHWVKNYKVDGLRFDLMAIIDKETMNQVKEEVRKINSDVILYGEPWLADGNTPLPEGDQTKKNAGVGFFDDTYRNALRGDNNPKVANKGYVTGDFNQQDKVLRGLGAQDSTDPEYIVNYVEAHDNYAIWDQVERAYNKDISIYRANVPENALEDIRVRQAVLANAFVLLSQGIPFYQGGSEILRTKQGDHNSYKSNDQVNDYDWEDKLEFKEVSDYYKGLIALRKSQSLFRLKDKEAIDRHQQVGNLGYKNYLTYQYLQNNPVDGEWKNILVIYNVSEQDEHINWLPGSTTTWKVVGDHAGIDLQTTKYEIAQNGNAVDLTIKAKSLMIMYNDGDEAQNKANIHWNYLFADQSADYMQPLEPTKDDDVIVRFRAKAGEVTDAKVHYYLHDQKIEKTLNMTPVADEFYVQKGYDSSKITFFEATIPASEEKKYYRFEITNKKSEDDVKTVWLNGGAGDDGRGISDSKPDYHGFAIVPDYHTPKWSKESILYQIMVDRFRDGDEKNNRGVYDISANGDVPEISPWNSEIYNGRESDLTWNNQFFGGDLVGVREALPYLKDVLGVNAIYFMPIFQSDSDHKYDGDSYDYVDTYFGGNQALASLGKQVKSNGMNYILDGVFNHSASTGKLFKEHRELFFKGKWYDDYHVEYDHFPWHGKYFNFAKLDYSKQATKDYIYAGENSVAKRYLKAPYSASGWRLDAAEDVNSFPRDFKDAHEQTDANQQAENLKIWQDFRKYVREENPEAFILGEYWGSENHWYYNKAWDGKMNYGGFLLPFIENRAQNEWLGSQSLDNKFSNTGKDMSVADIAKFTREYIRNFPYASILNSTNSISTHDKPRFLNMEYAGRGNDAMMQLAQTLQMTMIGIPMIYYGDEIGTIGKQANDPYNRSTFNWNDDEWDYEMLNNYRQLIHARKNHPDAFVYGAFEEVKKSASDKHLVYARYGNGDAAIVVLNNKDGNAVQRLNLSDVSRFGLKENDELVDVLSGKVIRVSADKLVIESANMSAACYVKNTVGARVEELSAATFDIGSKLAEHSDERIMLHSPKNAVFEKKSSGEVQVQFELDEQEGLNSILIRAVDANTKKLKKEVILDKAQRSADLGVLDGEVEIVLKSQADRSLKAGLNVEDKYRDGIFVKATKKAQSGNSGSQGNEGGSQGNQGGNSGSQNGDSGNAGNSSNTGNSSQSDSSSVTSPVEDNKSNLKESISQKMQRSIKEGIKSLTTRDSKNLKIDLRAISKDAKTQKVEIPLQKSDVKEILAKDVRFVEFKLPKLDLMLSKKTMEVLSENSSVKSQLIVDSKPMDKKVLKNVNIEAKSDVYHVVLGEKAQNSSFEVRKEIPVLRMSLPYEVKEGESVQKLFAYAVDDKNGIKPLASAVYDEKNKKMNLLVPNGAKVFLAYREDVSNPFGDVKSHYAQKSIDFVANRGLMSGISPEVFAANEKMSRAMFVSVLGRIAHVDESKYFATAFKDVDPAKYYAKYAQWANEVGISAGVGKEHFAPEQAITREQAIVMFARFMELYDYQYEVGKAVEFKDQDEISDYAKEAVKALQTRGIISGRNGEFDPKANITRAEFAILLQRMIEKQNPAY